MEISLTKHTQITLLKNLREKFEEIYFPKDFFEMAQTRYVDFEWLYSVDKCIEIIMSKGISRKKALCCFELCYVDSYIESLWLNLQNIGEDFFLEGEDDEEYSCLLQLDTISFKHNNADDYDIYDEDDNSSEEDKQKFKDFMKKHMFPD